MRKAHSVESATRVTLEHAEALDTALGQAALVLAARLDVSDESGSALAAMTRELRTTLEAATKTATPAADPVDELTKRRAARVAAS